MKRLIKLQVRNIFHNKLFYICLGIMVLMQVGFTFIGGLFIKTTAPVKVMPEIISMLAGATGIISTIFITVFCTFDFSEGTTKNIVARGYSKKKLLLSKYMGSLIGIFTMQVIMGILIFFMYIKNGLGYESTMLLSIIIYVIGIIAYTILYATLAFILEKTSSAIIANLFAPNILLIGIGIADTNLKTNISKYWIDNVSSTFLDKPTIGNMVFPIIMYIIYIVALTLLGIYSAKNKEIK